jgi:hypothetical protein
MKTSWSHSVWLYFGSVTLTFCVVTFSVLELSFVTSTGAASDRHNEVGIATARTWYSGVVADLEPLGTSLVSGLTAAGNWEKGQSSAAATSQTMVAEIPILQTALSNLEKQAPLPGFSDSLTDYVAGINLYLQSFRLENVATQLSDKKLVFQLQRSFERIRELGDVAYDEGTALLAPLLGSLAGNDQKAAKNIPDWSSIGLAPGSPLETSWSGTRREPAGTQSDSAWAADVRSDGAPPSSSVRVDIDTVSSSTSLLAQLARDLQKGEVRLSAVPAPQGHSEDSAQLRIGLLVDVEATLAAEAEYLSGSKNGSPLSQVASSLVTIGDNLRTTAGKPR